MSFRLPPIDLECPDPANCPVIDTSHLPTFDEIVLPAGREMARVYDSTWGYDEHNPGVGDTRFAPFDSAAGHRVPTMYLAADEQSALLESVFHEVAPTGERIIYERQLQARLLVTLATPVDATLVDLRDAALQRRGVLRSQLVSSSAEHYPCTRRVARALHAAHPDAHGLIWHSRQAELTGHGQVEVVILFGDRSPSGRGTWRRIGGPGALYTDRGRGLVDVLAGQLGAVIVPFDDE